MSSPDASRAAHLIAAVVRSGRGLPGTGPWLHVKGTGSLVIRYESANQERPPELPAELRAALRNHRAELLAWLKIPASDQPEPDLIALDCDPGAFAPMAVADTEFPFGANAR